MIPARLRLEDDRGHRTDLASVSFINQTKIICTIGPSSRDRIPELIGAGMDIARINFRYLSAHSSIFWLQMCERELPWIEELLREPHFKAPFCKPVAHGATA